MVRNRIPMTVEKYLDIQGKIVSRKQGSIRKHIRDTYIIKDDKFVEKGRYDAMIASKKAPLCVASKDPSDDNEAYLNYLSTNLGFIQELTSSMSASGKSGKTEFNPLQALLMNSTFPFFWVNKTRQFGFSYLLAARALAKAMIKKRHTQIFVSYNEDESKEKIVYAKELYESMPLKWRIARKLKYDNKTSLVFEKSGQDSLETRILSYPQRIIRGKGGELDIALDEAAHCIHIRKIYTSAMPALSRSQNSTLWMGSSPAGKEGLFYEVGSNYDNEYSVFTRMMIPWWVVPEFCVNIGEAKKHAWDMHTDERVARYATERIKLIRKSMVTDDFKQEYECEYLDEKYSYFPWDLINACVPIFNVEAENMPDYDSHGSDLEENDRAKSGIGIEYYNNFDDFADAVKKGKIQGNILGGFDVGRTTDASEICYTEENPNTYHQTARCIIQLKNVPLPEQRRITAEQFRILGDKLKKFGIDYNGLGRNITEDLEEISYEKVVRLNFNNNAWKEEACRRFKFRMEKEAISLPTDRRLLGQIHSIKRILLSGGLWRFDSEANSSHHGDKFWALLGSSDVGFNIGTSDSGIASFDERIMKVQKDKINNSSVMMMSGSNNINPWSNMHSMNPMKGLPGLGSYSNFGSMKNLNITNKF